MISLAALDKFPPVLVRMMARKGKGWGVKQLTLEEIAARGGLPLSAAKRISSLTSWADVTIARAEQFCVGCGVTQKTLSAHRRYLVRTMTESARNLRFLRRRTGGRACRLPHADMLVKAAERKRGRSTG